MSKYEMSKASAYSILLCGFVIIWSVHVLEVTCKGIIFLCRLPHFICKSIKVFLFWNIKYYSQLLTQYLHDYHHVISKSPGYENETEWAIFFALFYYHTLWHNV